MMPQRKSVQLAAVSLLAASLGCGILLTLSGSHAAAAGYCPESVVKDYLAPLKRFPSREGFVDSGKLRVGPKVLRIYPPREQLVVVGSGAFEARGSLSQKPHHSNPRLGWWIESDLERIDPGTGEAKVVKTKRQFITTIKGFRGRNFGFGGPFAPGIYRLRLRIYGKSGKTLTEYNQYFRAMRASSNLRLSIEPSLIAPGGTGWLRIENRGTLAVKYVSEYKIWRMDGSELPLPSRISEDVVRILHAGRSSPCFPVQIPSDAPPGEYSIGLEAKASPTSPWKYLAVRLTIGSSK